MLFGVAATFGNGVITTLAVIVIGWLSYRRWFRKKSDEEIKCRMMRDCGCHDPLAGRW
jgi:hypothetical protein